MDLPAAQASAPAIRSSTTHLKPSLSLLSLSSEFSVSQLNFPLFVSLAVLDPNAMHLILHPPLQLDFLNGDVEHCFSDVPEPQAEHLWLTQNFIHSFQQFEGIQNCSASFLYPLAYLQYN